MANTKKTKVVGDNGLTFTAEAKNSTVTLDIINDTEMLNLEYQLVTKYTLKGDKVKWIPYHIGKTIFLENIGDGVKFRNVSNVSDTWKQDYNRFHRFRMTGKIKASGSIMYLFSKDGSRKTMPVRGCYSMFMDCVALTTAPELPATTLNIECYYSMFSGCKSLTSAPELPAVKLDSGCYSHMFSNCVSLVKPPILPATKLADYCYYCMFDCCTLLDSAPELPATKLSQFCYAFMFNGCESLVSTPVLPATELYRNCYYCMFRKCTSLRDAPTLPATKLASECYGYMFAYCTNLKVQTDGGNVFLRTPSKALSYPLVGMFNKTGGIFTGDAQPNSVYGWYR